MRVLSLFSGGGLGDYGLELAGMEIVGQVEIDDYCQKILKLRWPGVPKWGDIREVKGKEVIERCGRIDLISGGFPCQDISQAGKGAGIKGERSGLWKEMLRIICEVRPRYVLVENVSALLGRGLGTVLGDLAESGYDAEWDCIPASAVGAPHQRDRVWIVAYTDMPRGGTPECGDDSNWKKKIEGRHDESQSESCRHGEDVADSTKQRLERRICERGSAKKSHRASQEKRREQTDMPIGFGQIFRRQAERSGFWSIEPNVGRVAHGVASRVDRLKLLGNGQVVQVVQWIGEQIMKFDCESRKQEGCS